jgi:hypothetical protein
MTKSSNIIAIKTIYDTIPNTNRSTTITTNRATTTITTTITGKGTTSTAKTTTDRSTTTPRLTSSLQDLIYYNVPPLSLHHVHGISIYLITRFYLAMMSTIALLFSRRIFCSFKEA